MANEKRLIDANALKEILQEHHDFFVDGVGGFRYLTPKDKARVDEITNCICEVCNAPTVDAVEVRCAKCKHYQQYHKGKTEELCEWGKCKLISMDIDMPSNGFCCFGERRTNEPEEPV